ncbi:MAG: glycosyltransferase family 2 protein, partial [Bacteroidota bacterium]
MTTIDNTKDTRNNFEKLNVCVLIPTYNNEKTLRQLIEDVLKFTDQIIVVNDGATDSTPQILSQFPALTVVTFPVNKGKGIALREGFKKALEKSFRYAISIDSDGQHFPSDFPKFLEKISLEPDS